MVNCVWEMLSFRHPWVIQVEISYSQTYESDIQISEWDLKSTVAYLGVKWLFKTLRVD